MNMMTKISVSIVNVTSYSGLELLRLLSQHPHFDVNSVTARSAAGQKLYDVFPQFCVGLKRHGGISSGFDPALVIANEPDKVDLAFVCLPHAAAAVSVVS